MSQIYHEIETSESIKDYVSAPTMIDELSQMNEVTFEDLLNIRVLYICIYFLLLSSRRSGFTHIAYKHCYALFLTEN